METLTDTRTPLIPPLRKGETYADRFPILAEIEAAEAEPGAVDQGAPTVERYLSKQGLAEHYAMSVRWVEQKMQDGLPVADYMDGRARFRLSETDTWLRQRGHLSANRPKGPRRG